MLNQNSTVEIILLTGRNLAAEEGATSFCILCGELIENAGGAALIPKIYLPSKPQEIENALGNGEFLAGFLLQTVGTPGETHTTVHGEFRLVEDFPFPEHRQKFLDSAQAKVKGFAEQEGYGYST